MMATVAHKQCAQHVAVPPDTLADAARGTARCQMQDELLGDVGAWRHLKLGSGGRDIMNLTGDQAAIQDIFDRGAIANASARCAAIV